jgi:hypothetical protein
MNEESLQFHIQQNDCFGTLATVVDLVAQSLPKHGRSRESAALARVRDQLMYLQRNCVLYCAVAETKSSQPAISDDAEPQSTQFAKH